MTDREVLLIAYGALQALEPSGRVTREVHGHLFREAGKPSEPAPTLSILVMATTVSR